MSQIWHIFRKDVRHHWPGIVVSLALLVGYVLNERREWTGQEFSPGLSMWLNLLASLVPVSWALLILRDVQDESLVGDRQFWVTRPYDWEKLLATKMLAALALVNGPLLIAQVVLLELAEFRAASYVPGLLYVQLLWMVVFLVPTMTLGTVTSTIGQAVLVVLAVALYFIAAASIGSALPAAGVVQADSIPGTVQAIIGLGAMVVVIFWQYRTRLTGRSRGLLIAAGCAILVIIAVAPYRALIERAYPLLPNGKPSPVQLAFDPQKPDLEDSSFAETGKVHVRVPLLVSGIAEDAVVSAEGMLVTVRSSNGLRWSSGWSGRGPQLSRRSPKSAIDIAVDKDFFDRVKDVPVSMRLEFAVQSSRRMSTERVAATVGIFPAPDGGRCWFTSRGFADVQCMFPLREPFASASVVSDEITCVHREKAGALPKGTIGYSWLGYGQGSGPAEFGISPVKARPLMFYDWGDALKEREDRPHVCPGTPITFSTYRNETRTRVELEVHDFRMADYLLRDRTAEGLGTGIVIGR